MHYISTKPLEAAFTVYIYNRTGITEIKYKIINFVVYKSNLDHCTYDNNLIVWINALMIM